MTRSLCVTSADGQTGRLVVELLLTDETFSNKLDKVCCLTLHPSKCEDLKELGAEIIPHNPGDHEGLVTALKNTGADTIFLIPPAHKHKVKLAEEMLHATHQAQIKNTILLSAAACEFADAKKQPHLHDFIKIEGNTLAMRYLPDTEAGLSQCVIRAGFYTENLLLYNKDAQKNGKLRLPIGETHSFAPVALGDIAQVAAHIVTSEGPQGLDDRYRGQLVVVTGPMMVNGPELAESATEAGLNLQFADISEHEAKQLLDADTDVDDSEKQYLLEYYSLVREGKTNYVSTLAFNAITGGPPILPIEFFKTYDAEFKSKKRKMRK
ncbi:hypothetical protein SERLA73DRAFT_180297 [Serpula lacrymans var. lacrymans S7.3]|uniref:NmrA-like domain-containing protein n=2 Tax=Serpula lacrymans var. lacrymans TaxID=341189 RepID=F8PU22_SERL3|nr:uncharacterized protein SERLADRAFT_465820 [Serpula lacrymans var. lacrymans S7.9]EGN99961.1 hypothetical protein SERLA73DRAFT_180297 [Serpula lacrymans var. lacrymans S7.3]EGO25526.1 hypothetical protein SERLADRAFT_465820 [Serpula lacrymans var. lacrymans S7.9]